MKKGDQLLSTGTIQELSEELKVQQNSLRYLMTPVYQLRIDARMKSKNARKVVCLGYDDE